MAKSLYLQTIGGKLDPKIDFLWTGPRVVSRQITVESIKEVTEIVKRPVTIWDNLHANDYDQTRLYLGPYDGRPTELVNQLRGVLTNPNCEFEANFIAMHTLAQWSINSSSKFPASHDDNCMETEGLEDDGEDGSTEKLEKGSKYCPKKALVMAVTDWLPELYKTKKSSGVKSADLEAQQGGKLDANHESASSSSQMAAASDDKNSRSPESRRRFDPLSVMDVILLCDLFYLPYEHGPQASQLLQSARWLVANFKLLADHPGRRFVSRGRIEWYDKAIHFHDCYANLSIVVDRFVNIPNRELLYEMYSYINDMRSNLALVNSYIKWHGIDKPEKEPFKTGEQEPWVHRGGLLAEFRRLLPIERGNDSGKSFDLGPQSYIIRLYLSTDKDEVYAVCMKTFDDRMDASDILGGYPQLAGDLVVGALLRSYPQHCFVVEDEMGLCGFAAVAPSASDYYRLIGDEWMPELRKKYQLTDAKAGAAMDEPIHRLTLEDVAKRIDSTLPSVAEEILSKYPGFVQISIVPGRVFSRSVTQNLMRTLSKVLGASGLAGFHTLISIDSHAELEFYYGLGLTDVTESCVGLENWIVLAKSLDA